MSPVVRAACPVVRALLTAQVIFPTTAPVTQAFITRLTQYLFYVESLPDDPNDDDVCPALASHGAGGGVKT